MAEKPTMDQVKAWLKVAVGVAVVVAGVFGITDYALPREQATLVQAVALILYTLLQRYLPPPGG